MRILKKKNNRKCIITNQIKNKEELIRIVKLKDGTFEVNSNSGGRGAYISKDKSLINKINKQRILNKVFRTEVPNNVYEELEKVLEEA